MEAGENSIRRIWRMHASVGACTGRVSNPGSIGFTLLTSSRIYNASDTQPIIDYLT